MTKQYKCVWAISCLLVFLVLVSSGPAFGQGVFSDEFIRKRLLAKPEPVPQDQKIGSMGPSPQTRSTPPEGKGYIDLPIPFPLNQYLISPSAVPLLEALGRALAHDESRGLVFEIQGHTCDLGSDEYNLKLSEKRAMVVKDFLVGHFRLSPSQIRAVGYGKRQPLGENNTEEGRARNRRVTVLNTRQPFSDTASRIEVKAQVKYLRGKETMELKAGQTLTQRDNYSVFFNANEKSHVYVFQVGADSAFFQIFPNPNYSEVNNPVESGRLYRIPSRPDQWLYLDDNKGDEEIVILASPETLNHPLKVARGVIEGTTMLAQKSVREAEKPVPTMGLKGRRTVEEAAVPERPQTSGAVNPETLFTWRFPFRHQ